MISRGCSIAADLLVAGITWWNAHKVRRLQEGLKVKHSMQDVILYDGTSSFRIETLHTDLLTLSHTIGILYFVYV